MQRNTVVLSEHHASQSTMPQSAGTKKSSKKIIKENSGQGAAEYILLFGGVIVIALAGLLIYRSYFSDNASGLNATQDIISIRNNVTSIY